MEKPRFITVREIHEETQIPRQTLYKMIHDGRIPGGHRFVPNGNTGLRVERNEYERWIAESRIRHRGRPLKRNHYEEITIDTTACLSD